MNTKRQTVWLVSMLSLMVILSAYYLFTEDSSASKTTTANGNGITAEATGEGNGANTEKIVVNDVEYGDGSVLSEADKQIIDKFEEESKAASSSDYFTQQQFKREETVQQEYDRLMGLINDTQTEEVKSVMTQVEQLEQHEEKINDLEASLRDEFKNVVVAQEKDSYKVVVEGDKLERSQADSIIQLVINTLEVSADRVSVQLYH
ncbi:SpoIIIAH-like family protein [Paenibacillus sp. GCM10012307]|uniref:SpoIIIAH-like family protein n=1 Tax=Paenibacillus roseus TaxID=2798579 RepID=A0A934MRG6_9BACL|nr:SpoIIIAH-like family protein [Paenibacillus roseus]MBJ6364241.1 SpoIIIAH-like family protein [Paenibacillus roseus]